MFSITSKNVLAVKGTPLIYEEPFNQVQDWLNGVHPLSPDKKKYDSGKHKQTRFDDWLGLDSQNERAPNPGAGMSLGRDENESQDKRLSSGYNDGEQADDETGPGHKSEIPDPYFTSDTNNELFMDLKLKGHGSGRDSPTAHMRKILTDRPVVLPHRRYRSEPPMN